MGKYDGLRDHIRRQGRIELRMTFAEIAALTPGGLPASAYQHQAWWANEASGSHVEARAWLDAGYHTSSLNLTAQHVTFVRTA